MISLYFTLPWFFSLPSFRSRYSHLGSQLTLYTRKQKTVSDDHFRLRPQNPKFCDFPLLACQIAVTRHREFSMRHYRVTR